MSRNVDSKNHMQPGGAGSAPLSGEQRSHSVASPIDSVAATPGPEALDAVVGEYLRQVKSAQRQIEILVEKNMGLQKALRDIETEEIQARHLAYHDGLTGLPNRRLLHDRFRQALSHAERHQKPLALLMLDLDKFKCVNDSLGHACGDALLQAVALRLTKGIRVADTACRYGGDEFVIMLTQIDAQNSAAELAAEIGGRLGEPYVIGGHKLHLAVSIGVAVYPGDGKTFDDLMKQADGAMYRSKGTGRHTFITEVPKENAGDAEQYHPSAIHRIEGVRRRDLLIQAELRYARDQH